jgi:effector-binding domain-containing protein
MNTPPEIATVPAQLTAVIRLLIPRDQIRVVMGPAMQEVMQTVHRQGLTPAGPMFTHHFRIDPGVFDFEVGVPLASEVNPDGRVVPSFLPATKIARTVYTGSYEKLGAAWEEFDSWITANGHSPKPDLWERYLSGPQAPEPSTELVHPLND